MKRSHIGRRVRRVAKHIESLEPRQLLSATLTAQLPSQNLNVNGNAQVDLTRFFDDPQVTGTAVEIQTPEGNIPLALTDTKTRKTVQNFVSYINAGEYANVIIHRLVPGFVFQGGGFTADGTAEPTFAPVKGESGASNLTGTIAMALSSGPNSGTNQWFINLGNNNGTNPVEPGINLDNASDGGPFTVFGSVIYNGMNVVAAIASLPTVDDSAQNGNFSQLPVINYTGPNPATTVPAANQVVTNTVVVDPLTYSVTVADPTIATASITKGKLTITPVSGMTAGSTTVTVTATDLGGGVATSTFTVTLSTNTTAVVAFGAGIAKSVTYTDTNGTVGTIALQGPGNASIIFSGTNVVSNINKNNTITVTSTTASITSVSTSGTTAASSLVFTTKGGSKTITIGSVNTDRLKAFNAKGVILDGDFNATDLVGAITIAGSASGTLSAPSITSLTSSGAFAGNLTVTGTGLALGKFTAGAISGGTWTFTGGAKSITAGSITAWTPTFAGSVSSLTVSKGDLSAAITAASIGMLHIKGSLNNATVALTGGSKDLTTLSVNGGISGSTINATGNLGNISAGSLNNSNIYAGIAALATGQVLPNFPSEIASNQSITSVKLKTARTGDSFFNSNIAASTLSSLSLGTILTNNGGITTGVAANKINSLVAIFAPKHVNEKKITSASDITTALAAKGVELGDFVIKLF